MERQEFDKISHWADDMNQFVMVMMDHMKAPSDYGTGTVLNMVEMYTLAMIAERPGLCVGEVAKLWNRTMSAASRNIDRLCAKDYIEKKKLDGNAKNIHLYVTEKGQKLADLHRRKLNEETARFAEYIQTKCSTEEMEEFFRVMKLVQGYYEGERK